MVADSSGYLKANFLFASDDWDGTRKTAQFKREESELISKNGSSSAEPLFFDVAIDDDSNCTVPWEVLKGEGVFNVNVYGQKTEADGSLVETITVNSVNVRVGKSGLTEGQTPQNTKPNQYLDIYQKMVDEGQSLVDKAQAWAEGSNSPDGNKDERSPTGYTQSSKEWALYAEKQATNAANATAKANDSADKAEAARDEAVAAKEETEKAQSIAEATLANAMKLGTASAGIEIFLDKDQYISYRLIVAVETDDDDDDNNSSSATESEG